MQPTQTQEVRKTVHVRHHASFSNTKIGGAIDAGIASAITIMTVVGITLTVDWVYKKAQKANFEREMNNMFTRSKTNQQQDKRN